MTTTITLDCEYKQKVRPGRPLRPFPGAGELFRRFGCATPSVDFLPGVVGPRLAEVERRLAEVAP